MTVHRFYIPNFQKETSVILPKEICWQISKVLRLKIGDPIIIFDGQNHEYTFVLSEITKKDVLATYISEKENLSEPSTFIVILQSLIPRESFEEIIKKSTEAGASEFIPMQTARTIVHAKDINEQKLERWQKIIQEAAEQSERGRVPLILPAISFENAIEKIITDYDVYIAWEKEENNFLSSMLEEIKRNQKKKIAICIGPEGGFTQGEIDFAKKHGVKTVSLGPRILRSETVAPIITSLILFMAGDLNTTSNLRNL